ncbi:uncharacterized protein [Anabrus simplex]|uniref:uncharacterized protein n=1 Tax=Anabrus simplex TaxID=316456 RepID=UPI0035A2BD47
MTVKQTIKLTVLAYLWIAAVGTPQNGNPSNNGGSNGNGAPGGHTQQNDHSNSNGNQHDGPPSDNAQNQWQNAGARYPASNNGWSMGWAPPVSGQPVTGSNYPPNGQPYPGSGSGYLPGGYTANVYPQSGGGFPAGGSGYNGGGSGFPPVSNAYPPSVSGYYTGGNRWSNPAGGKIWYGGPSKYPVRWDGTDSVVGWYSPNAGNAGGAYQWAPPNPSG